MLRRHFRDDGQHARRWREQEEECRDGKTQRPPAIESHGSNEQQHADEQRRQQARQQSRWPPVVVEDERRRPHDKTEVVSDDTRLRHQVAPPRPFSKAEAGGIRPVRTGNQHRKKDPCRCEPDVQQAATMQERAPGLDAGKHRIPGHDQQRRHDHRLLARHSGSTGRNRCSDPPTAATPRPDAAIQRQQDGRAPSTTRRAARCRSPPKLSAGALPTALHTKARARMLAHARRVQAETFALCAGRPRKAPAPHPDG